MMLKYYPSNTVLKNKFLTLCGQHYGIMESQILTSSQGKYTPKISVCTANMPAYQKAVIDECAEINHHLSGYGVHFEEAMVRLLGEGIERYAQMDTIRISKCEPATTLSRITGNPCLGNI